MDLSIIIVNYNTKTLLKQCLNSLMKHPTKSSEIIVVDNASADGSVGMLRKKFPKVKIIANKTNRGFGAAKNQGVKIAKGEFLLSLDSDTEIKQNVKELLEYLEKYPKIGILGCQLVDKKGKKQQYIAGFKHTIFDTIRNKFLKSPELNTLKPTDVDWVTGAFMLMRRKVFEELNGFDEQFFLYFEDEDLCLRAEKKGLRVVYYPRFSVIHIGGASSEKRKKWKHDHYFKSQELFYQKHHGLVQNLLLKVLRWPLRILFR